MICGVVCKQLDLKNWSTVWMQDNTLHNHRPYSICSNNVTLSNFILLKKLLMWDYIKKISANNNPISFTSNELNISSWIPHSLRIEWLVIIACGNAHTFLLLCSRDTWSKPGAVSGEKVSRSWGSKHESIDQSRQTQSN